MKAIKIITLTVFGLFVSISSIEAQQVQNIGQVNKVAMENLTEAQKLMLEQQKKLIKHNREAFKASLSAEQLAILENVELTKKEKHSALVASFSTAQQKLLQEQRMNIRVIRQQFRSTLTDEQLQQIRTRLHANKNIQDGKELMDRVRDRRHRQHN